MQSIFLKNYLRQKHLEVLEKKLEKIFIGAVIVMGVVLITLAIF